MHFQVVSMSSKLFSLHWKTKTEVTVIMKTCQSHLTVLFINNGVKTSLKHQNKYGAGQEPSLVQPPIINKTVPATVARIVLCGVKPLEDSPLTISFVASPAVFVQPPTQQIAALGNGVRPPIFVPVLRWQALPFHHT